MKKCVKKIPKYNGGTGGVAASVYNAAQKDAPNILNTQESKDFIQTADNVDLTLNQLNPFQTEMNWAEMNNKLQTGSVLGAVGTAVNLASNSIGKEVTWQDTASGALLGAAAGMLIGGPWGALIGGVAGAGLSSIGTGGDVNMDTGEITMPSGIAGMFGHSKGYLRRKSNMVKNALASRALTENLRTDYYNNTPGAGSINVLAAEGGIMRQPVDALVSKGELIYNPVTKKLSQVPGSKGKPNRADDVYAKLYEGDVVISNSPTMLMANGKTPAQNLMGMVDKYATGGTVKAREAVIKKVVNWQEANKTKPQEYAKFSDGTGEKGVPDLSDMFLYRQKDGKFVMQDINGNRYDVPEMMLQYIQGDEHGYWFGPQTGVAPSAGKWNGSMNFAKQMANSKNIAKLKNSATKVFGRNTKPANMSGPIKPVKGTSPEVLGKPKTAQEAAQMARNERTANMWQQLTSKGGVPQKTLEGPQTWSTARGSSNLWENPMALQSGDDIAQAINKAYYLNKGLPTAAVVATMLGGAGTFLTHEALKDKSVVSPAKTNSSTVAPVETPQTTESVSTSTPADKKVVKPSNKKVSNTTTTSTPAINVNSAIKNSILPEYDRLSFAEPFQFNNQHLRYAPGNYVPIKPLDIEIEDEIVDEVGLPKGESKSNINWDDLAYKAAVLTQPLWGRAKAEPVNYTLPNAKYIPVGANVKPLYRQADETYSMGRYNFANLGGNTGANMAYGAQLAANRAKQYADAYQWQQNVQNDQIAKNIGIYSDWDTQRTEILNNVYDKNAANRATARNINRQNAAAALKNWGTMGLEGKQLALNESLLNMYEPMANAVLENPYSVINPLRKLTKNYGS